ncbi:MAG: beta-propeller domain-containing protein [Myxococcota bacterium]
MRRLQWSLLAAVLGLSVACGPTNPPSGGSSSGTTGSSSSSSSSGNNGSTGGAGRTNFETPLHPDSNGTGSTSGGAAGSSNGGAQPGAPEDSGDFNGGRDNEAGGGEPRLVEESDIYKLEGNHLFVLNRYRGLQIIDLSNLDAPRVVGRVPIYGYPREMYVREGRAYVIVSDYYTFWRNEVDDGLGGFYGSQLRIIDVSNLTSPHLLGGINLEGDCTDSRIVGDVMYLVSHRYPWYWDYTTTDTEDKTSILSVTIADPTDVHVVDTKDFPREGWEHHIHVNSEAIYLASSGYQSYQDEQGWWTGNYVTDIKYIDISDPAGAIRVRGGVELNGRVMDRWSMDAHENVLRVASGESWGNGDIFLRTYDVTNPDLITPLGEAVLHVDEQLTSARFAGNRGYLVSYRNIDPLFVFDLSNPAQPTLLGELEMTGWLDFMIPLAGDRVVALGHEDLVDANGNRQISLAVSLIDVATNQPALLSRVVLDGIWGWIPAERDDFAKVFRVLPEQNLILFPFQAWSPTDWRYVGGVQLVDLAEDTLVKRGLIGDAGWVERGVPYNESTVLTISSQIFQVMDITNRDEPSVRARLELARNVGSLGVLPGDLTVQLSGDWYLGDTELTITPLSDPNAETPVAKLRTPAPYGRMFSNGAFAYVTSTQDPTPEDTSTYDHATRIQVVDLQNPAQPTFRGELWLPEPIYVGYGYYYWGYGDEVAQVNGNVLVFHRYTYEYDANCWEDYYGSYCEGRYRHLLYVVDLSDPDAPALTAELELDDVDWSYGLRAHGNTVLLSSYRTVHHDGWWFARYSVHRVDVSNPAQPQVLPEVNIPGWLAGVSDDGQTLYTLENYYDQNSTNHSVFHVLQLHEDHAELLSSVELEGYPSTLHIKDGAAFTTRYVYDYTTVDGVERWDADSILTVLDISDPQDVHVAGETTLPMDYGWLMKVEGNRAFVVNDVGIFTVNVQDITAPTYEAFFRTMGWAQDIVVHGSKAYVPSGYHGVQVLDLNTGLPI